MRVMFIYPQLEEHGDIPIALTLLVAVLRQAGHTVSVFDCSEYVAEVNLQSTQESFGMFKPAPPPPVEPPLRKDIRKLDKDLLEAVGESRAGLIGITVTTGTYALGLECSKVIKRRYPKVTVIMGGIHATICPEEVISQDSVDIVCVGEGEDAILELCSALDKKEAPDKIRNLWIKDKKEPGAVQKNPLRELKDLSSLPIQDFSDFHEYDFYRPLGGNIYKMLNTEISRGCIFKCYYCANHFLHELFKGAGNYHRRKDVRVVIRQLKELKERYQFNAVRFWDEDFTVFPLSYLKELSKVYVGEIRLPFVVYAGTRTVTEEKVACLKEMGCITMAMAIESGNPWLRKYVLNRNITDEDIIKKYEIVKKSGIRVSAYNMIGLPFETREMVFDTIRLNRKVKPADSSVSPFNPYPKTRLEQISREFGFINGKLEYSGIRTSLESPHLNKDEVDGLVRTFSFYTKLPEDFFPLLKECEKSKELSDKVFPELVRYLRQNEGGSSG